MTSKEGLAGVRAALKKLALTAEVRPGGVEAREDRGSVVLEGKVDSWAERVEAGVAATRRGYKGVVNDVLVRGAPEDGFAPPEKTSFGRADPRLDGRAFDVVVVGGGVVGAAVARELARFDLSIALLEKEADLAMHTSGRNDGMIHDGFAAKPGTRKAAYNVRGNRLWGQVALELGLEFKRPGSLLLFDARWEKLAYPLMADRARRNGVDGWEYWPRAKVFREEPHVTPAQRGAFFLPSAGCLSPYRATVALAENAAANGAEVFLETSALGFVLEGREIRAVRTDRGDLACSAVVNAAGNWADVVAGWADDRFFSLHQRRGTDAVLDLKTGRLQRHIAGMPKLTQARSTTKGGGLVVTVDGNLLLGPTARELPGREDYSTTEDEIEELGKHLALNTALSRSDVITYFAGVRPCTWEEDFVVETSGRVGNLVHAAGIQSPGLASAPAIAQDVAALVAAVLRRSREVRPNPGFDPRRAPPPELRVLDLETRARMIALRPDYGRVACRCEEVSEGEIRDALRGRVEVRTLDAVKRRTRAGMGRCHGGFCGPRVLEVLADARGIAPEEVTKKGGGSEILVADTKAAPARAETEARP